MQNRAGLYVIVFSLLFNNLLTAQKIKIQNLHNYDVKPLHFGFVLGINQMNFSLRPVPQYNKVKDTILYINSIPDWGFHIGIISDFRLRDNLNFRIIPSLSFGDRAIRYEILERDTVVQIYNKKIESTFVEFPFLLKFKSDRLTNFRCYLIGGPKYSIDLASMSKKKHDNEELVKLRSQDITCEIGIGFDFYLEYFKFGTEIKMAYGLNNVLFDDNTVFSNSIDYLKTKIFYLSFTFE